MIQCHGDIRPQHILDPGYPLRGQVVGRAVDMGAKSYPVIIGFRNRFKLNIWNLRYPSARPLPNS